MKEKEINKEERKRKRRKLLVVELDGVVEELWSCNCGMHFGLRILERDFEGLLHKTAHLHLSYY